MSKVLSILFIILIVAAVIFFLYFGFIQPIIHFILGKGKVGEMAVARKLNKLPEGYAKLHNVIIPNGKTTSQIDHIVVSPYGIFVIETKNYQGLIYGGENAEYWTQNIYGHKKQFYNPIQQNQRHIKALQHLLAEYPDVPLYSIIAFSNKASVSVDATNASICNFSQIKKVILGYCNGSIISPTDINNITATIMQNQISGKEAEKVHTEQAKETAYRKETKIANGICPRCGGKLVTLKGKYGYFTGCSNYPKCKFTM